MKNQDLPFQIGGHYENWEFDLEVLDIERIKGYDSYIYIREIIFLGAIPRYVELIFSWDILEAVILVFSFNNSSEVNNFKKSLDGLNIQNLKYKSNNQLITLMYGRIEILKSILK